MKQDDVLCNYYGEVCMATYTEKVKTVLNLVTCIEEVYYTIWLLSNVLAI